MTALIPIYIREENSGSPLRLASFGGRHKGGISDNWGSRYQKSAFRLMYFGRILIVLWAVVVIGLARDVTACAEAGSFPEFMVLLDW